MTKGILIFAHNNPQIDYGLMAIISGGLAKKNLNVPVSLVTDKWTIAWLKESNMYSRAEIIFDKIIEVEKPATTNYRKLHDGVDSQGQTVPFINSNRYSAWELTPYDRTLLIDSDFLIFSNSLSEYWDLEEDVLIGESINDIYGNERLGYHDVYVSDVGVKLYWATTVMFTKNKTSKLFFDTVSLIKENYQTYADIFRFDSRQFRNDIAFSIAKHILEGFETSYFKNLPPVLTLLDKDILYDVADNRLALLVSDKLNNGFYAAAISGIDIHIMNKQSIIRNTEKLLELI